jgi:hypothetical protein
MADTSNLLACTYGTSNLVVVSYNVRETPNLDKTTGARVGTFVRVEAECEVRGTDPESYATALQTVEVDLRVDGRDFTITGLNNQVEYYIPSSGSIDAGPHCGFEMSDGESALSKKIKLIVTTQLSSSGSSNTPVNTWTVKTVESADGLQTVTWTGQLTGLALLDYFTSTVYPAFQAAYAPPGAGDSYWSTSFSIDQSQTSGSPSTTLKYTMTAKEFAEPLPSCSQAQGVDGSITEQQDCDEHFRKTTTTSFDILILGAGDPIQLLTTLRPTTGVILREQYKVEQLKENRLSGSFIILQSNDPSNLAPLMNFQQTARLQPQNTVWEEKRFVGTTPILIQAPAALPRLTQSGSAIAAGKFFQPTAIYPTAFVSQPEISLSDQNYLEKGTNWIYEMIPMDAGQSAAPNPLTSFNTDVIGRAGQAAAFYPGTAVVSGSADGSAGNGDDDS